MSSAGNPLIPAGYDIAWSIVAFVAFALMIVAIVSLARWARRLTPLAGLLWTLVVLFVPVIGSVSWLAIGRRSAVTPRDT